MNKEIYEIFKDYKKILHDHDIKTKKYFYYDSRESEESIPKTTYEECCLWLSKGNSNPNIQKQIAIYIKKDIVIIDVENKPKGKDNIKDGLGILSFKKMVKELELPRTLLLRSKQGGYHAYYRLEDNDSYKLFSNRYRNYEDIEILWGGGELATIADSNNKIKILRNNKIATLKCDSKAFKFFTKEKKEKLFRLALDDVEKAKCK